MSYLIRHSILIVFCSTFLNVFSQTSFWTFEQEENIDKKALLAVDLHDRYLREDIDSIKIIGAKLLFEDSLSSFAKFTAFRLLGAYYLRKGLMTRSLQLLKSSANYFEEVQDYDQASETLNHLGHALFLMGEYDESKLSYNRSLRLGKLGNDASSAFNALLGLGKVNVAVGDTLRGEYYIKEYKRRALELKKFEAVADAYGFLGMVADEKGNRSLAHEYYLKSFNYSMRTNSKIHMSHAFTNRAIVYFDNGELAKSLEMFEKALKTRTDLNNGKTIIESYYNLASYYQQLDDRANSLKYYYLAENLANEEGFIVEELDAINAIFSTHFEILDAPRLRTRKLELEKTLKDREGVDEEIIEGLIDQAEVSNSETKATREWKLIYAIAFIVFGLTALGVYSRAN